MREQKDLRYGRITSSEIVAIVPPGKRDMTEQELALRPKKGIGSSTKTIEDFNSFSQAGITYLAECNIERRLGRRIDSETDSRPTTWGRLMEYIVQQTLLGPEYKLMGTDVVVNEEINCHAGSPDCQKADTVVEIKGPFTCKSFCMLVDPIYHGLEGIEAMNAIRNGFTDKDGFEHAKHTDGEKFYWQLVSNAVLTKSKYAELIVYCPYKDELSTVIEATINYDGGDQNQFEWLNYLKSYEQLPYLIRDGYYKSLNKITIEVPETDKELLLQRIKAAEKYLIAIK